MFEIFYFLGLSIGLGIVVGCLISLFLEDISYKPNKTSSPSMKDVLKDLEDRSHQNDIDDEMADLRRRLGGK